MFRSSIQPYTVGLWCLVYTNEVVEETVVESRKIGFAKFVRTD